MLKKNEQIGGEWERAETADMVAAASDAVTGDAPQHVGAVAAEQQLTHGEENAAGQTMEQALDVAAAKQVQLPRWLLVLLQSLFVGLFVLVGFLGVHTFLSTLAIASLAASAFIAFGFPVAESARPRYLVGGYACAVVFGVLCSYARMLLAPGFAATREGELLFVAVAVGLTALAMLALNLQHPPSCALAASLALDPDPLPIGLAMMACIALLCLVRWGLLKLLGKRLPRG